MAKLWTYVTLMVGLTFLLKIAGIPTGVDWFLSFIGYSDGLIANNSTFYIAIVVLFAFSVGASIVIGAFGRTAPEYSLLAPFATANFIVFVGTFISIANYMSNFGTWLHYPILAIMLVFGVGFLITTISYVFGRDT